MLNFLMDTQPLVPFKHNMYIYPIPRTTSKLWLFDTLETLAFLYRVKILGPSLHQAHNWTDIEKSLVKMIACMIRNKAPVHHDIILEKMRAAPIITETLF